MFNEFTHVASHHEGHNEHHHDRSQEYEGRNDADGLEHKLQLLEELQRISKSAASLVASEESHTPSRNPVPMSETIVPMTYSAMCSG